MRRMLACACGERTNAAYVWRGGATSSADWPLPARKRQSSFRSTRAPMSEVVMGSLHSSSALLAGGHGARAGHDALDDVVIPGAAAQIAFQALAHFVLARARVALREVERVHHHAGGAEAALQAVVLLESGL